MGRDHPDGTLRTIRAEVVGTTVVNELAANETPISKLGGKVTESAQDYQTLASWTVSTDKNGILFGVEFFTSSFTKTHFRLTIGAVVQWEDVEIPVALNAHFVEARLASATVVLLEGKSNDGTSVDMWGAIDGKEVG